MSRRFMTENYEEAFERDGSLRDLYVVSTTRDDWTAFLKFVKSSHYACRFKLDDAVLPIPADAASLFPRSVDRFPLLQIDIGGVGLNCHFYLEDEIEIDLDPREILDDARADAVLAFMTALGEALGKEVCMTAENSPDAVIFRYNPSTRKISYIPPPYGL